MSSASSAPMAQGDMGPRAIVSDVAWTRTGDTDSGNVVLATARPRGLMAHRLLC